MKYSLKFLPKAEKDLKRIKKSGDRILLRKLTSLLEELSENPTSGTGKPELLKHYETPTWSRRISSKHRLVYRIEDEIVTVLVLSVFGHYEDK